MRPATKQPLIPSVAPLATLVVVSPVMVPPDQFDVLLSVRSAVPLSVPLVIDRLATLVLRYANVKDLLISGLVDGGGEIAQHPAVLDVPFGQGHVVLFSINPVYRGETRGTYSLVLNTVLNFDNLNAGRKDAAK